MWYTPLPKRLWLQSSGRLRIPKTDLLKYPNLPQCLSHLRDIIMATNLVDEFPDDDFPISFDDYQGISSKFEEEEVFPSTSNTKCASNQENTNVI